MSEKITGPGGRDFRSLVHEAHHGSLDALGVLFDLFRRYLLRLGEAEIGDDLRAKNAPSDLVQDTFVVAQESFPAFEGTTEEELRAWLRQIFLRQLANARRHYRDRSKRKVGLEVSLDDSGKGAALKNSLESTSDTPDNEAIRREERLHFAVAVETLPIPHREVLRLRFHERQHFDEIGRQLGCSSEAARKLCSRAMRQLTKVMNGGSEQPAAAPNARREAD